MAEGVDYSSARPGGAALKAAGKVFAVRYLFPDGQGGKGLDRSELDDLTAHNIAVAVVYEASAQRALTGRTAGISDAQVAQAQLVAVGLPLTMPIYFATDWSVTTAQFAAVDQYLIGAGSILGNTRVGVYGGLGIIQHCQAVKSASWFWQTYAWSAGRVASGIHLYQYRNGQTISGGSVDFVRSMQPNYGQNTAAATAGFGTPIITPQRKNNEMSKLYYKAGTTPTLYALAGDSPGTPANWLETTDQALANGWSAQIGAPSIALSPATWDSYKTAYVASLVIAGAAGGTVDLTPVLDAIKAIPPAPTKATVTLS